MTDIYLTLFCNNLYDFYVEIYTIMMIYYIKRIIIFRQAFIYLFAVYFKQKMLTVFDSTFRQYCALTTRSLKITNRNRFTQEITSTFDGSET